jgi:OPT family oligopeptide transporter
MFVATVTDAAAVSAEARPRTAEEIERDWYENVYQGDHVPQLTRRALVMGMLLGVVMTLSNLYVGLKAGWGLGVVVTSTILAFAVFQTLHKLFPKQFPPFGILENNAMASCASAAGYITGGGVVNAIPALMMLNPAAVPSQGALMLWVIVIAWLGVFLAIPAKRQMINIEQLPFPSGIAAATTMRALHTQGDKAMRQARALGLAGLLGGIITWFRDVPDTIMKPFIPSVWAPQWMKIGKYPVQQLTLGFEGSLLFVAAGAIIGFRQAWSLMLGAIINYAILAPHFMDAGVIATSGGSALRRISSWSLWIGVPMMVTSGLLLFFIQWKTVVRAFSTITSFLTRSSGRGDDPLERIEVPGSWFMAGLVGLGLVAIVTGHAIFGIKWWMGAVAVLMTVFLVVVAGRATGETDITPTGPLSKITQLTFGALSPGNITTNLMTANITAGSCSHAGDLLTDLKSGYLLGAKPRQQFFAQFFGVLVGGVVVVPVFFLLIPDASLLGTEKWPAPAAQVWRAVAELLSKGVGSLPVSARWGLLIGSVVGIILPLLELAFPKHKKFIPSATGLGIAFTINGFNAVSMFIGSLAALILSKVARAKHEEYTVPVASGIIAGESLVGVLIAILTVLAVH